MRRYDRRQVDGQLATQRAARAPLGPKPRYASHGPPVPPPRSAHNGFLAGSTTTATSKNLKAKGPGSKLAAPARGVGGTGKGGGEGAFKEVLLEGLLAKLRKKLVLTAMRHLAQVAAVRNRLLEQIRR
jgi:hypothetical protein